MCGRIARDHDNYAAVFGLDEASDTRITPRFNIAPTQLDLFIRAQNGRRYLVDSVWGLIPAWARDRAVAGKMFNARAETLLERPAYRTLVARHRCIVPASGFYEWHKAGPRKQPFYIYRADGAPLALAGLWTVWRDPARTEPITSHTIITCPANAFMARIHDRMPVVLERAGVDLWLDEETVQPGAVLGVLQPCADAVLAAHPVASLVNSVRNEGPTLIAPTDTPSDAE